MLEYLPSFERNILSRLRLNASDAARICSITPRQLKYWTTKGFIPIVDDSESCYDITSVERAILIRRVMGEGYTLEMAAKMIGKSLTDEAEEQQRLASLSEEGLKNEISGFLEHLEDRIAGLREDLPAFLTLSKLGATAVPPDERALELFFEENPYSFDTAPNIAFRLGYTITEVERILEELINANVLLKSEGDSPIYRLRKGLGIPAGGNSPA